jgi:hypothetical protein
LSPLTKGVAIEQLSDRLEALTTAIVRAHLFPAWDPAQATTVKEIAAIGGETSSNRLFDRFHPRALVLPFLTDAFLAAAGALPRTIAYELYVRTGFTGEDARTTYGAHKEPGIARAMVIGGLAAMTGDTHTPVSMFPVVHGTWDDPNHPKFEVRQKTCNAAATLRPFRLELDGSIAVFCKHQFALLQHARAILESAAERGSRVCEKYEINPQHLLDWAMPNRVVIGPLRLGASATSGIVNDVVLLPGLDADLLRTANKHGVEVLTFAFDQMTETVPQLLSQLEKLAIVSNEDFFHGPDLTDLLTGDERWDLPGLDEISSSALNVIGKADLAGHSGVKVNSAAVRYFRVPHAILKAPDRRRRPSGLPINLLAHVRQGHLVVWSTTQPLSGAGVNQPVLTSEMWLDAELGTNASTKLCLDRFFEMFRPHKAHPAVPVLPRRSRLLRRGASSVCRVPARELQRLPRGLG